MEDFYGELREISKAYADIFKDGAQWRDIMLFVDVTTDLWMLVRDHYADKSWQEQLDIVVDSVDKLYQEKREKLPWWLKWIPLGFLVRQFAAGLVKYLEENYEIPEEDGGIPPGVGDPE